MSDKKEVFDYLRNRQKAAEIEAKVNGINMWVLLGAIGFLSWQLLGSLESELWIKHREIVLRVLLVAVVLRTVFSVCSPTRGIRDEPRFATSSSPEVGGMLLALLEGALITLPAVALLYYFDRSASVFVIALFGGGIVVISIGYIFHAIFVGQKNQERFPEPRFSLSKKTDGLSDVVFFAFFVWVLAVQAQRLWIDATSLSVSDARTLALAAALYALLLVAVRRRRVMDSLTWTYELETDVLVGAVSPDAAVGRIEYRALGPRLQDVVDRFFADQEKGCADLEGLLGKARELLRNVETVPAQFKDERKARIDEATAEPMKYIKTLTEDGKKFLAYVETLKQNKNLVKRPGTPQLFDNITTRHSALSERVREVRLELEGLASGAAAAP